MAVEPWVPGKFYAPGDLTIPTSTLLPEQSGLPNGNFESGDVEWTKQTGFTIVNGETAFQGTWSAKKSDGNPSSIINDVRAPVTPGQSIRASCMIKLGSDSSPSGGRIILRWYASGGALLSTTGGSVVNSGTGWKTSTVTGAAPSGAATVSVEVSVNKSASQPPNYVDNVSWSYTDNVAVSPKLVYKAVQADIGKSGLIEPTWPATLGQTVVDNEVTWEAIGDTRIVWTGTPLFLSGEYEPTWPTAPGDVVADNSIGWQCVVRNVTDENCPNTRVVLIAASKIFAIDDDIIAYSATVNPLDWSTENDAGYLPTGLQQYGSNPMAAMGLYRGNLVAWNAQGAQIWQVDEDPARMALLDTLPIGCTFPKSVAPIADDLFFVTQLGIRSFGLAAGSTNLATGDVGVPIDPLVEQALRSSPSDAKGTYLPSKGQYWVWFQGMYIVGDAPNTYVGATYSHQYEAVGGVAPITYAITSGELPDGLSMNSAGLITGAPTTEETQAFTVTGTDAIGTTATLDDSIDVAADPYLIVGNQALSTSPKGAPDNIINTASFPGINFKQGVIADDVMLATAEGGYYTSSDDGATWSSIRSYPDADINFPAVAYSPSLGRIVIATSRTSAYSDNGGDTWTVVPFITAPDPAQDVLSIVWAESLGAFFMFGGNSPYTVYRSTDGTSWSSVYAPGGAQRGRLSWLPNNGLLALGQASGGVGLSSNGTDWSTSSTGASATIFRVAENGTTIMALYTPFSTNAIRTSANGGASWSAETSVGLSNAEDLWSYGNKWVLGVGANRYLSTDGTSWTAATTAANSRFFSRE